jgi:flagellar biosynthesis protein FlhF
MDLRTFQASTMSAALAEVKSQLGPSAVILHTRTFSKNTWLGLRRRAVVEITAGRQARTAARTPPPRAEVFARPAPAGLSPQPMLESRRIVESRNPTESRRQLLESPAGQSAVMLGLSQEIGGIKTLIKELVDKTKRQNCPAVPEELFEYYSQLIENDVAEELASDMIKTLQKQIRPEHACQGEFVREKLRDQIEKLLPSSGPIVRTKTVGPHVVALIGPTGVGKTTTIAKLAANLMLREKRRVGFVTLDTYRIAAVDQLRRYATILGAPMEVVGSADDLKLAIKSMSNCEFILIDTAGRSPKDALKLSELKSFLAAANPDEVHLVLSSTASQQCVELAIARFSEVRVDKIIFTKLDEAAHLGVVLNVICKVKKALSYVTTGQDVPDDIEVGRGRLLAQMILGKQDAS